jgi:hypothetical protein
MHVVVIAAAILAVGTGGCATLTNGAKETVYVVSDPPGAKASVSFGSATCITPCSFDVNRADAFSVGVEKPGYGAESVPVKVRSTASPTAVSRELTADYLGRIVDFQDGANEVHEPNPVKVKLEKTEAPGG